VLDGGLAAWRGADGAIEEGERDIPDVAPPAIDGQGGIIGTRELAERLGDPRLTILDSRSDDEAADDLNGTRRVGQIPGSIRVPWTATLRDDAGRLKSPEELAAQFLAAGVAPEREVAVVARFGVETGQPWWVLRLLGYPTVRVYDQGWAEWGAETSGLPIEALSTPAAG
jgi:thiosulfate/3-mercaptopyruvate sulfurtransferase